MESDWLQFGKEGNRLYDNMIMHLDQMLLLSRPTFYYYEEIASEYGEEIYSSMDKKRTCIGSVRL